MKINVDVIVPDGTICYSKNGTVCDWRSRPGEGHDCCMLYGKVGFSGGDRSKCYDCLRACVRALEARVEQQEEGV